MFRFIRLTLALTFLFTLMVSTAYASVSETWGESTGKDGAMTEFYRASGNIAVTSEGTGLSSPTSGSISINNIPSGATVHHAWLYWAGDIQHTSEETLATITFNGNTINYSSSPVAVKIGSEAPAKAANKMRHVFRSDVTSLLSAGGNGTYSLSVAHGTLDTFGASLVIAYEHSSIQNGYVVIHDGIAMLSGKNPNATTVGNSITSTISDLVLGDPPVGQSTIIVSEGTAEDVSEFSFSGATTHNYGDFATNSDGNVWDDFTIDVGPYLSTGTTSVSATLTDIDKAGAYANYYVHIFQSTMQEADLSESTMAVSNVVINPEEEVTYTITIPNKGISAASSATVQVDFSEFSTNTNYVLGSTKIGGISQTDASDGDGVYYNGAIRKLNIDTDSISSGGSKTITFRAQARGDLAHGEEIDLQGQIWLPGSGKQWKTDGDGTPTDGIDRPTNQSVGGGKLTDIPSGFTCALYNNPAYDPCTYYQVGSQKVKLQKNGGSVAYVDFNLDDSVSISTIDGDRDDVNKKAFFHGFGDINGASSSSYTLVVPGSGTSQVRLCLGATSLAQVGEGCADDYENVTEELVFTHNGHTQSGISCTQASGDWECSGVTGTGGQGEGEGEGEGGETPEMSFYAILTLMAALYFLNRRYEVFAFANS